MDYTLLTEVTVTMMRGQICQGYINIDAEGVKELPFWIKDVLAFNEELIASDKKN